MDRRDFLKKCLTGSLACGLGGAAWPGAAGAGATGPKDLGMCRSVKITCVSEIACKDPKVFMKNMWAGGGPGRCDQWAASWDLNNGAGFCALIQVEGLEGERTNILFDVGWNPVYMAHRFQKTGVDKLLRQKEIDWLIVSHEHADHFWGLGAALDLDPEISLAVPATIRPEGREFIAGRSFEKTGAINRTRHQGRFLALPTGKLHRLGPGMGLAGFDGDQPFRTRGEQSLIFNIQNKGLVLASGCCHQTIITFIEYTRQNVGDASGFHGLYGGLHLAPYESLGAFQAQWIRSLAGYGFEKLACNHCTGIEAVELMRSLGYPVVRGRGADGSRSDLYLGHGDSVVFG